MTIQQDWVGYRNNLIMDFGDQLTEVHLTLLRHAFFCGASVTYANVLCSAREGAASAAEAMTAIRDELELFMAERHDDSIRLH